MSDAPDPEEHAEEVQATEQPPRPRRWIRGWLMGDEGSELKYSRNPEDEPRRSGERAAEPSPETEGADDADELDEELDDNIPVAHLPSEPPRRRPDQSAGRMATSSSAVTLPPPEATVRKPSRSQRLELGARIAFGVLVALAAAWAIWAGAHAKPASGRVPDWALNDVTLYRFEVGVVIFVLAYAVIVCLTLALMGRGFTKFSGAGGWGVEAPERLFDAAAQSVSETKEGVERNQAALDELLTAIDQIHQRVRRLERRGGAGPPSG